MDSDTCGFSCVLDDAEPKLVAVLSGEVELRWVKRHSVEVPVTIYAFNLNVAGRGQPFFLGEDVEARKIADVVRGVWSAALLNLELDNPVDGPVTDFFVGGQVVVGRVLLPLFGFSLSVGGGVAEESALWLLVRSVREAALRVVRTTRPPATREATRLPTARATEMVVRRDILALVVATFWGVLASVRGIF
jgi:hypothetical protein